MGDAEGLVEVENKNFSGVNMHSFIVWVPQPSIISCPCLGVERQIQGRRLAR